MKHEGMEFFRYLAMFLAAPPKISGTGRIFSMRKHLGLITICVSLVACDTENQTQIVLDSETKKTEPAQFSAFEAETTFENVRKRMEPLIRAECRRHTNGQSCRYRFEIDPNPNRSPNAYLRKNRSGEPVIGFTLALVREARNADEIALVMGHEAAHHIQDHLRRGGSDALNNALDAASAALMAGKSLSDVRKAQESGLRIGSRMNSKDYELEADQLGTLLTMQAGYDPILGMKFFDKIPDPGNKYLGSHPPHAKRLATIRAAHRKYAQICATQPNCGY
jgi:Zn-dependent protease with chaperone function